MKKLFLISVLSVALSSSLFANNKIVVGATPVPHAEILEAIAPELEKAGYELEVKVFNDYVIPDIATNDGELDATFHQHKPFLEEVNKNKGTNLVPTVAVHIEPMGVYSQKIKHIDELKDGSKVSLPNDPTNESRALDILETIGLIELDKSVELKTPLDITKNPKNLSFIEVEAASVPRTLNDADIAIINMNYALNANLNPSKDALAIESFDSPYANVVAVKAENKDSEKTKALDRAITSQTAKDFINQKYGGAILPVF